MANERGAWSVTRVGPTAVRVVFSGHMSGDDGEASAKKCAATFGSERLHIVVHAPDFEGYESHARTAWQRTMWPLREQIRSITLYSKKPLIRMGVSAFALFVGARITLVDSEDAMNRAVAQLA